MILEHQEVCNLRWSISCMVILMLVRSTCKRSIGAVDMIGCKGTLGRLPSCCKQCMQDFMGCCTWLVIPGHQKCCALDDQYFSGTHSRVTTQCALGTTKSRRSSVSPLGVEHRYQGPLMNHKIWSNPQDQLAFFTGGMFCQKYLQICLLLCLQ